MISIVQGAIYSTAHKKAGQTFVTTGCSCSINGAPGRIRTSDRLVRSQVLYPAELRAHTEVAHYMLFTNCVKKLLNLLRNFFNFHAYSIFYRLKSTDYI
jgi:hypothetical protein